MGSYDVQKEVTDKYSLRGRVFHRIREDILSGKYEQNEELKEAAIGAELGVSRTPVREALRQLELEGLVTIVPNKGAYVNGITSKDVKDIYAIRSYLEMCIRDRRIAGWKDQQHGNEFDESLCIRFHRRVDVSEYDRNKAGRE